MKYPHIVMAFLVLWAGAAVAAPDELEDSFEKLKQAEEQKDAAQVKTLAAEVHALVQKAISEPAPQSAEEKEAWTKHIAYLKDVDVHTEYSLFAVGTQSAPAVTIDLISTLEAQNPKSKYLDAAYGPLLLALNQTGAAAKIPSAAEKGLVNFPENEDLLAVATEHAFSTKQFARAATLATRMTTVLSKHPKPEGYAAADWERRKNSLLGRGYWIAAVVHVQDARGYAAADREFRAALPFIKENASMAGPALFYLGVVNYQLGKQLMNKALVLESAQFSEQSLKYPGIDVDQARHNALVARTDAAKMR